MGLLPEEMSAASPIIRRTKVRRFLFVPLHKKQAAAQYIFCIKRLPVYAALDGRCF